MCFSFESMFKIESGVKSNKGRGSVLYSCIILVISLLSIASFIVLAQTKPDDSSDEERNPGVDIEELYEKFRDNAQDPKLGPGISDEL